MTFWKTQSFKALQKEWYQRLKDDGFQDAEEVVDGKSVLKQIASHVYRNHGLFEIENKEAYYQFISQKVQETVFAKSVDRIIMSRHAEGRLRKHIVEELEEIGEPRCRNTITFRIRKYEMEWGMRQYTPKQLNKKVS